MLRITSFKLLLLIAIAHACICRSTAIATIWRFLPGDAFFESTLTEHTVSEIEDKSDEKNLSLDYFTPSMFEGVSGYAKLEITDFPKKRRRLLRKIYEKIRLMQPPVFEIKATRGKEERRELNGIKTLIYNKDFDYEMYGVGLRYNENWAEEGCGFGSIHFMVEYPSNYVTSTGLIVEDWRNSKWVLPLNAKPPEFSGKSPRDLQYTPVSVKCEDVKLIFVVHGTLERIQNREDGLVFYLAENDDIFTVRFDDGEWTRDRVLLE